ncbi:uncharacterized protein LOC131392789 [Diceros bicornis minor]|uniref:uncharacterized protein LOC131392789 n=1 Tax=Diceros bicornis minor TaxID=77932 RepID=UPI0026F200AA|nr:uncharacterized protein LOC131392789 [Diceros bicornis minor]
MSLLEAFTFLSFWAVGLGLSKVEQSQISISTEVEKSIDIHCKISSTDFEEEIIHWYRQGTNETLKHLIYVSSTKSPAQNDLGRKKNKLEARKDSQTSTSIFTIKFIEKEDEATYYCAGWHHSARTVETTHTRSPPWVCAHPHPSQQWEPQPGPSWAPGLSLSFSAALPELSRKPFWICLHITFQLTAGIVLPKLYLTLFPNELKSCLGTESTMAVPLCIISPSRDSQQAGEVQTERKSA